MKKRIVSMLLAIVMVVGLIPGFAVTVSAATDVYASGTLGQYSKTAWTIYNNGLLVIDGKGNSISTKWDSTTASPWKDYADIITRASFVNCENWVRIPENTFRGLSNLKEVILPENIEEICQYAFSGAALETIILPERLETIGNYAFSSCESLNYININDGVTSIGSSAFYNCSSLKAISIPDSVTSIGQTLFQNCGNLEYVRLSERVDKVGGSMFFGCAMLKNVSLPASVTVIGSKAFSNASNLTGVYYHGTVEPTTYNPGLNNASFSLTPDTMVIYASNDYSGTTMGLKATWENDVHNVTKIDGYFVNVAHTIGGAVKVDKSIVPVGDTVTVDIMAYKNYVLDTFAVTGADGNEITVTGDSNTCTFAMPEGNVTITATFKSTIVPHVHSWTFEAEGTYINATCANTDDACHNPYQSVVMTPPSLTYFAWNLERTVKVSGTIEDVEIPEVVYTLKSTGKEVRPFEPGVYVASLTIEDTTLTYEYEITKSNQLNNSFFTYTAPENLTYDGTAKIATVVPNTTVDAYIGDVEVLYNGSSTPPVTVGTYTVTFNVEESDYFTAKTNLALGGRGGQKFSIVAKDIEDLDYTGLAASYPVGATPDVTIKYNDMTLVKDTDYTLVHTNNTEPGTATITVTGIGNYTGTKTLEFEISAHDHSWTYTANGSTITAECSTADCPIGSETLTVSAPQHNKYGDGKNANATLSVTQIGDFAVSNTDIVYTKGNETLTAAPTDAGTYKASITVDTDKIAFVEYTIAKADAEIPTGLTSVYGRTLNSITLPDGWSWVNSGDTVGEVNVENKHLANYAGDGNHNSASNIELVVEVTRSGATMTATADKNSYTYGEDITVTVNIAPTAAAPVLFMAEPTANQVAIFNGSTQITEPQPVNGTELTFTVNSKDKGLTVSGSPYTLTAKYIAGNMEGKTANTQAIAITQATPIITAPTAGSITYGQTLESSALTGGEASVAGSFAWAYADTVPTVSGGSTGYEVIFTPDDTANYTTATVTVTLTVDPKDITTGATVGAFALMTYDGTAQTPSATVAIDGLTVEGNWSDVTNVTDLTTFTASGNFTGTIKNQNPGMQKLPLTGATITLESDSLIYNGSAQSVTITSVKVGNVVVPAVAYSVSGSTGTEVGSYTLTITAEDNSNFTGSATKDFTIARSGSVIGNDSIKVYRGETETTDFTYGDVITVKVQVAPTGSAPVTFALTAPTANQMALFHGDTQISEAVDAVSGVYTMIYDTTGKAIPVGTSTLTVKFVGNNNMADTAKSVDITLNKKPLTVDSAEATSRDYEKNNTSVEITGVTISGKALDSDDVSVDTTNLTGSLASDNAGTYTKATLPALTLIGDHKDYYIISGGEVDTNVAIAQITGTTSVNASPVTYSDISAKTQDLADVVASFKNGTEALTYTVASKSSEIASASMDGSQLTFNLASGLTDAGTAAITVDVTGFTNYSKVTVTVNMELTDKTTVTVDMSDIVLVNRDFNGEALTYTGEAKANGYNGAFTYTWQDAEGNALAEAPSDAGTYRLAASVSDTVFYAGSNYVTVTIAPKEVTVTALDKSAYVGSTAPDLSAPIAGKDYTISGLVDDTVVTVTLSCTPDMSKAGEYAITPSASEESGNYTLTYVNGKLTVSYRPSSGSSSNTTSKTEKNEDGSTTTTTTNKTTGTVTETTKYPDGSTTTVETKKDGSTTETSKTADGTTSTVVTDKDGNVTEASAKVPAAAVKDATESGEAVKLPVEVEAADDADEAVEIEVDVPTGGAKVEIPVADVTFGTVVVIVNADGTEEVVKTSTVSENGVVVALDEDATLKVVDNSKHFVDVHPVDHWAETAVDFVVARTIYSGTSATTFHPDNPMTRGMLAVVLHNLEDNPDHAFDGVFRDVAEGSWYEDAIHWAADEGIVSGYGNGLYGPNDNITREQLAVMLWRYAGSPDSDHSLAHFKDAHLIASYAETALAWANENGIINGKGDGILDPKGNATRAQVAQMLMNYLQK